MADEQMTDDHRRPTEWGRLKNLPISAATTVERIFRECNLAGDLTRAKLALGNAIDSAREQGRQDMRELMNEPDYEWE